MTTNHTPTLADLRAERDELQRRLASARKRGAKINSEVDKIYDRLDELDGLIEDEILNAALAKVGA